MRRTGDLHNHAMIAEIWATVLWSWLALRFWPERELALALKPVTEPRPVDATPLVAAFRRATQRWSDGRCLLFSVAMHRMLRRRSIAANLRVGFMVNRHGAPGHAWVETISNADTIHSLFKSFHISAAGLAALLKSRRAAVNSGGLA